MLIQQDEDVFLVLDWNEVFLDLAPLDVVADPAVFGVADDRDPFQREAVILDAFERDVEIAVLAPVLAEDVGRARAHLVAEELLNRLCCMGAARRDEHHGQCREKEGANAVAHVRLVFRAGRGGL